MNGVLIKMILEKKKTIKVIELNSNRLMVVGNLDKKNGTEQSDEMQIVLKLPEFEILEIQTIVRLPNCEEKEKINVNINQFVGSTIKQDGIYKLQQKLEKYKPLDELFSEAINTLADIYNL